MRGEGRVMADKAACRANLIQTHLVRTEDSCTCQLVFVFVSPGLEGRGGEAGGLQQVEPVIGNRRYRPCPCLQVTDE